ncbi:MAG: hypothetical protein DDT34_01911 [Firmicutes bacterium]|nr:hypothetical protein [Bacillota bacterium]
MKLNKAGVINRDPGALLELQRVVRHCARIGAARAFAQSLTDDIEQEVMMLVIERLIHVYDESRDVEPYLIDTCRNIGKGLLRKHTKEVLFSQAGEDTGAAWEDSFADPNTRDLAEVLVEEEDVRRANASAAIAARRMSDSQENPEPPVSVDQSISPLDFDGFQHSPATRANAGSTKAVSQRSRAAAWSAVKRERNRGKTLVRRTLSTAAVEMKKIRNTLRYTHIQMGVAMGVESHVIRNIEYGSIPDVSPEMLGRARKVLDRNKEDLSILNASGVKLFHSWCARLGLREDDYRGLSDEIGTNRSTTFRWMKGLGSPTAIRIRQVEALVQIAEERRARMASSSGS